MQNSIRDADYLPFLGHISPRMSGRLENTSSEVVASNRTSVYEGSPHLRMRIRKNLEITATSSKRRLLRKVSIVNFEHISHLFLEFTGRN